jgi:hypothetical protein
MKRIILLAGLLPIFVSFSFAQTTDFDDAVLSAEGREAYRLLLRVRMFAFGGVGYSARISEGEKEFDVLSKEPEALKAFRSLVTAATPGGALYGLAGLRISDCACFSESFGEFKSKRISGVKSETLTVGSGCFLADYEFPRDGEMFLQDLESSKYFDNVVNVKKRGP